MTEYLRLVGPDLQSVIHRLTHPDTGRGLTVIGTVHVGDERYFGELRTLIAALVADGAVVHAEGARMLPIDDTTTTPEERAALDDWDRAMQLERRRVAQLGWVTQAEALAHEPHWQVHELTRLDIIRRTGVAVMHRKIKMMLNAFDWPDTDPTGLARFRAQSAMTLRAVSNPRIHDRMLARDPIAAVVVHERNTIALNAVDNSSDTAIVLVWGAGHVPGLVAGLTERGYQPTAEPEWRTVTRLPSATVFTLLRLAVTRRLRVRFRTAERGVKEPV